VFLLFLECVWQLQQQHGPAFQFSETYLTVLSDSVHVPVFITFLFNNDGHRDGLLRVKTQAGRHTHYQYSSLLRVKTQAGTLPIQQLTQGKDTGRHITNTAAYSG
jgi:hypothetical protein